MELLDRYLAAVAKHAPISERVRIVKLVKIDILAQIETDQSQRAVEAKLTDILIGLGPPTRIVNRYLSMPRYIIGPATYDAYWRILTLVFWAIIGSLTLAFGIELVFNGIAPLVPMFFQYLTNISSALAQAFFWITLVFVFFERRGMTFKFEQRWHPDALPAVSKLGGEIKRFEPFVGLLVTSIFFAICYFMPQIIGLYYTVDTNWQIISIFNLQQFPKFLPFFLIIFASSSAREIAKLMNGQWNYPVLAVTIVCNLLTIGTMLLLLFQTQIWNPTFVQEFTRIFAVEQPVIAEWQTLRTVVVVILIAIGLGDSIASSIRVWKLHQAPPFLSDKKYQ